MNTIQGTWKRNFTEPQACGEHIGEVVRLRGHVHRIRRMSGFAFVVLRTMQGLVQCLYQADEAEFALEALHDEMAVVVEGRVEAEPRSRTGWEIHLLRCQALSAPAGELPAVINGKGLNLALDTLLDLRPVTLRHPSQQAIFRVQHALSDGIRAFLAENSFTEIHSPKLVANGAEGGANVFDLDYFGQTAYLAQSPQLYKQMMVGVFERVFEIAPVFRAEKHDTARHLSEYTSVDLEMGFIDSFETLMALETAMLQSAFAHVQACCGEELALLGASLPEITAIPTLRFEEAKALVHRTYGYQTADARDLDPEEERLLCRWSEEEAGSPFVFITHYPSAKRPFYTMDSPGNPQETESFDLLFRGLEVTTGGQRIHDYGMQVAKMQRLGMEIAPFEAFLMAHRAGLPPHGGMGIGLERLTARLLNLPNVRQATLFPRDKGRLNP